MFLLTYRISNTLSIPTFLNKPKGFEWTDWDLESFVNSFPFNCAVGFNNMEFLKKYTDKYFRICLDNEGGYVKKYLNLLNQILINR